MEQLCSSVESIMIQGRVEREFFTLSNLPSLTTVEMGRDALKYCHSIVFESMND